MYHIIKSYIFSTVIYYSIYKLHCQAFGSPPAGLVPQKDAGGRFLQTVSAEVRARRHTTQTGAKRNQRQPSKGPPELEPERQATNPFFICKSSHSFFLSILYQKNKDFSNVRKSRAFKSIRFGKGAMVKGSVFFTPEKHEKPPKNQGLQRNSLYNHANRRGYHQCEALYIINTQCCISSSRR